MNRQLEPVLTIDGASGTGKGTVGQRVATCLGWHFLDSGALYRVLALAAKKHQVSLDDEKALSILSERLEVQFRVDGAGYSKIILEGNDVSLLVRTEETGNAASMVAALPSVRESLLGRQRAFREKPGLVADGRDMGTVVFPDALFKFYLAASPKERALRRYNQLKQQGIHVNLGDLINELRARDKRDTERVVAPLRPADDAIHIQTDQLSIDEVVGKILAEVGKHKGKKAFPVILPPKIDHFACITE